MHIVVSDTTPLASFAVTTASLGPFTVPSAIALFTPAQDLKVYNGTTLLTYNATPTLATEWKFTGTLIDGGYQGGSITLGATVTNTTILVFRDIPIARTSDFNYPSPTVDVQALNTQLDKIFAIEQDNELRYSRTVRAPLTDTVLLDALPAAATRASKFLAFDANGQPTALPGTGTAGAAGQGVPIAGAANQILAKINSTDYNTQWLGLSALIDAVLGSTRGQVLARNATVWAPITVGAAGTVFRSDGTDPSWAALSAVLDVLFGTTQGGVVYRGAATWAALAPGTSGQFLQTLGAGSNVQWASSSAITAGTPATLSPLAGSQTVATAHGLAGTPKSLDAYIECLTAELGWAIGDRIPIIDGSAGTADTKTFIVGKNATNCFIVTTATASINVINKTTNVAAQITYANWKAVVQPYYWV